MLGHAEQAHLDVNSNPESFVMKILLINYHYFINGGPDRYFFNVKSALEAAGHQVIPFCFNYDETLENSYRGFFPNPISGKGPALLSQQRMSKVQKVKAIVKMFYNREVNSKFRKIIKHAQPDIVYLIYLSSTLLPNIIKIAKKEFALPVVYRLSDFHMFCPSYIFYRDGHVCTECEENLWSAVKHKCVHNSQLASLLRALQIKYVRLRKWYNFVDAFVCPSKLMQRYLQNSGFQPEIVFHLPTFSQDMGTGDTHSDNQYILYFGRVSEEKGPEVLLKAYNMLPTPKYRLELVGPVNPGYREHLLSMVDGRHRKLVQIKGPQHGEQLQNTIRQCKFAVQPTLWYENMPNAIIELMSAGKAIIASDLGSLPELVRHEVNGLLVKPGDAHALAQAIMDLSSRNSLHQMGKSSRAFYEKQHTPELRLSCLMGVFNHLITQ